MNVSVTARHCEIGDGLRRRITVRAQRLGRYNRKLQRLEVVFDGAAAEHAVEARATVDREPPLVGLAAAPSFRIALDRAMDKLERQARRARERRVTRKAPPISVTP